MDAPVGNNVERLEVALARAVADEAVVRYATLPLLLRQLPEALRREVREAFDAHRPFGEGAGFFIAHVRLTTGPDGLWGIWRCSGHHKGYMLAVVCDDGRYRNAIRNIRAVFARQQESIALN